MEEGGKSKKYRMPSVVMTIKDKVESDRSILDRLAKLVRVTYPLLVKEGSVMGGVLAGGGVLEPTSSLFIGVEVSLVSVDDFAASLPSVASLSPFFLVA